MPGSSPALRPKLGHYPNLGALPRMPGFVIHSERDLVTK